ncbi:hypothetical protein D7193_26675 [Micromonospora costi]|uniref:Uncharacterized protein n=1 Tax=Micromonospora costi TaxID=1530042 RepID=A0A3A9ZV98_9ACTN|nr:hypothetical protein D7193_26675 [Micromonospora costi]
MNLRRLGDVVVGTAGDVAGGVVDPRRGLDQLRSALSARTGVALAAGLVVGFLAARSRRPPDPARLTNRAADGSPRRPDGAAPA